MLELLVGDHTRTRVALIEFYFPNVLGHNGGIVWEVDGKQVEIKAAVLLDMTRDNLAALGIDHNRVDRSHHVFGFAVCAGQLVCAVQIPRAVVTASSDDNFIIDWEMRHAAALDLMRDSIVNLVK